MTSIDILAATLMQYGDLRRDEPLSRHTTIRVGGPADLFVTGRDAAGLAMAARAATDSGVPVFVLGSGSNILVADRGIRGVVIDNRARGEAEAGTATWQVESGMSFAGFARKMCRAGLDGAAKATSPSGSRVCGESGSSRTPWSRR